MQSPSDLAFCSGLAQRAFAYLLKNTKGQCIRTNTMMSNLGQALGVDQMEVKGAVRELYRSGLIKYMPDRQELPASGMVEIVRPEKTVSVAEKEWCRALDVSDMSSAAKEVLRPLFWRVSDLHAEDMDTLTRALARLESTDGSGISDAGFNVSARTIMGGSKVLANLAPKMLHTLGLPARLQTSSPRYVICAGSPNSEATLLIENPRAFENAVRSGLGEHVALVCTYGFGLSYLGQAWREDAHDEEKPIQIVRAGAPGPLTSLLLADRVFLWADLDLAALCIFKSLKTTIPQLKFSGIYKAMIEMAQDPESSHPYAMIFEKEGQSVGVVSACNSVDPFVQSIMTSCRSRAVDQEAVSEQHILEFGRT